MIIDPLLLQELAEISFFHNIILRTRSDPSPSMIRVVFRNDPRSAVREVPCLHTHLLTSSNAFFDAAHYVEDRKLDVAVLHYFAYFSPIHH